jgi:O-antigen biosynthesis protein
MLHRVKVVDIELSNPLATIEGLDGYEALQGLVRLHGVPVGYVSMPVTGGRCTATALGQAILAAHSSAILRHLLDDALAAPSQLGGLDLADLLAVPHPVYDGPLPLVTVAVCTRDRTANLARCLDSLARLDYPALEILVVDNAPSSDATQCLVQSTYPHMRYVCEPRPGLNWARNRAIVEARGEIIAYTDDDVVVDPGWVKALASVFAEHAEVMAVTGSVVPYELDTEAQVLFEQYGGFTCGFERQWYRVNRAGGERAAARHGDVGKFGTGANMAYRRRLFDQIGTFDPALDVGTVTNGGGDLEMFFRVLKEGYTLVYEPSAIVRHCHRRSYAQLRTQITNHGIGFVSCLMRSALAYPDERVALMRIAAWWLRWWLVRRLLLSLVSTAHLPRDLIVAELQGFLLGLRRYQRARRSAARIAHAFSLTQPTTAQEVGSP